MVYQLLANHAAARNRAVRQALAGTTLLVWGAGATVLLHQNQQSATNKQTKNTLIHRVTSTALESFSVAQRYASSLIYTENISMVSEQSATTASTTRMEAAPAQNVTTQQPEKTAKDDRLFYGQCLERQVYKPRLPYPAWNKNWDGRHYSTASDYETTPRPANAGKTRHILLIRHGQYEQRSPDDKLRRLTPLGRRQAAYTGQRLAQLLAANAHHMRDHGHGNETDRFAGPCRIKSIHTSTKARARETAAIILQHVQQAQEHTYHEHIPGVEEPDPLLDEALPAPIIPERPDVGPLELQAQEIDENHDRIEAAFQKYIHRADRSPSTDGDGDDDDHVHEFELIVGHANLIRYFFLRALQLPPEAWLRLSLFNCSVTYLMVQPNGHVTVRLVGDTGHIPYEETTFSGAYGYNWKSPTST